MPPKKTSASDQAVRSTAKFNINTAQSLINQNNQDLGLINDCITDFKEAAPYAHKLDQITANEVNKTFADLLAYMAKTRASQTAPSPTVPPPVVSSPITKKFPTKVSTADVPDFDGRASSWARFENLFRAEIVANPNIYELRKIELLSHAIRNCPAVTASLVRAYDNCDDALIELARTLADKDAILHDVFCLAKKAPRLPKDHKLSDWLILHDAVQDIILKSDANDLTQQSHLHALLSQKLSDKLEEYLTNGNKSGIGGTRTLTDLNSFITKCVQIHREIDVNKALTGETQTNSTNPTGANRGQRGQNATRQRGTFAVATTQRTIEPCYFCKGQHLRKDCHLSRQDRIRGCKQNGRCVKCLGPWDRTHNCNKLCRFCRSFPLHHFLCSCAETLDQQLTPNNRRTLPADQNDGTLPTAEVAQTPEQGVPRHVTSAIRQRQKGAKAAPYLGTAWINAINPVSNISTPARILVDNGSQSSFITKDLVRRLGLDTIDIEHVDAKPFGSDRTVPFNKGVSLYMQSTTNPSIKNAVNLIMVSGTMVGELPAPTTELQKLAEQHGVQLADPLAAGEAQVIDILIGVDLFCAFFLTEQAKVIKPCDTLGFLETPYGWLIQGSLDPQTRGTVMINAMFIDDTTDVSNDNCLCSDMSKLLHDPLSDDTHDEVKDDWCDSYLKSLHYNDLTKRYEAPLPWYNSRRPEPNYLAAFAHAQHLYKRLEKDQSLEPYSAALMSFVEKGYASQLPSPIPRDGHFVRHFPVYKEGSTTAIRPVFDASAASRGSPSLNTCIYKGAWDQTALLEIILKWRLNPNVLLADIRQAFMQIRIRMEDRKFVRFLWIVKGKVQAFEMSSLLFGASASPFILYAVLKHLFETRAADLSSILANTYMDDICLVADTVPELSDTLNQIKDVMQIASFDLHKFTTIPSISEQLNLESTKETASCLGVKWHLASDTILFTPPEPSAQLTRRGLASLFARTFDPLGLLGPAQTRLKLYMQTLIKENKSWDEPISMELDLVARALIHDLQHLTKIQIPRLVRTSIAFEVWSFADASALAYGIVYYIHDLEKNETRLLLSRSRVAAKNKTIPRLELVGALLAAETWPTVLRCLPVQPRRVRFFTDSMVTWHRIQSNPSRFEPYVSTRVLRIQAVTEPKDWYHIPGKQNPADLVSRGMSFSDLNKSVLWFQGPSVQEVQQADVITSTLPIQVNAIVTQPPVVDSDYLEHLIIKLPYRTLRATVSRLLVYMNRYANLAPRYKSKEGRSVQLPTLADMLTWKLIQSIILRDEISAIKSGKSLPKDHPLRKRYLFLDEFGLVRLRRRIQLAELSSEAQFPLVLMDHPSVRNYIRYIHDTRTNHSGSRHTILHFQQFTEFPNMHRIVKRVVAECKTCRRYRTALPFAAPMCYLPADRVSKGHAFQNIGMDIFGPIRQVARSDGQLKFYGLIFACAASRAIHLELIDSRSAPTILRAFHRFTDLYGVPRIIRSDNELSFEKLNVTLQKVYKDYLKAIRSLSDEHGSAITWIFNAPEAPSCGGFYERLIGPVKNAIDKCRLAGADTYEKIETLLREAQRIVNSRPLLTDSHPDPFTPAHLVFGRALNSLPPVLYPTSTRNNVLVEYSRLQKDLDMFWDIWNQQYLPTLQADRWPQIVEPICNELVIIQRDGVPRHSWKLARITRLIPGKDGIVRSVIVEPVDGGEPRRRAVHRLYPIERLALPPE